jgi:hypothetical protein
MKSHRSFCWDGLAAWLIIVPKRCPDQMRSRLIGQSSKR